ncbi:MAG TPA: ADP-glyceromanno-heptose 6-epimerase [Ignavibacteria bacterium]
MIIVTGGAGFIGSALISRLNQSGYKDIIVVDHFGKNEKYRNLIPLKFKEIFDGDEFIEDVFEDLLQEGKLETIFHLGACSSTTEDDFKYLLNNNFDYSKELCLGALEFDVRFIYASSAATYGNGSSGYQDNDDELDKLMPLNGYGYSKQLFDVWARDNGYLDKIAGLKYFNVFGPNEYHKEDMRSVVHKSFQQIKKTGRARLFKTTSSQYGDGEQERDFIYVKDAVDMTLFFHNNKKTNGIYNVGTGEANTFNSLVKPIFKILGLKEDIEYFDMPERLKEKYQDYTQADITKIRNAGYDGPITKIEEAVTDYVKNYLNTNNPYLS